LKGEENNVSRTIPVIILGVISTLRKRIEMALETLVFFAF
jgi:hypothetical protein